MKNAEMKDSEMKRQVKLFERLDHVSASVMYQVQTMAFAIQGTRKGP